MTLGKRVERIMFLGVLVTIACLTLMVVCLGLSAGNDRGVARAYAIYAGKIEAELPNFEQAWNEASTEKVPFMSTYDWATYELSYDKLVTRYYLTAERFVDVGDELSAFNKGIDKRSPKALVSDLRARSKALLEKPASVYGISIPSQIGVDVGATHVTSSLESMALIARIVLAPVLILWLGNYLGTRQREVLVIGASQSVLQIHPHLLNCFAVVKDRVVRKAERLDRTMGLFLTAVARVIIAAILFLPGCLAYAVAVFSFGGNEPFFFAPLVILAIQCLGVFILELSPPIVTKVYHRRVYGTSS
ncbi:hypothetical protein [Luteibacter aegosomatissinici]|uniref:hypothetical protein n=1 Tax=Luteibacter aegosomatissinici TaxID=2911539 RepID=UPI001FFB0B3D|nr:hypothetical protein [Luteibacter aegosomatissinici]UPG92694.1 hypothetical protein L2Y97_12540 [Luteibacter aegosomatissinici]